MRKTQSSAAPVGAVLLGVLFLGGCSVVNPYRSDFKCPPLDDGKCISVGEAYDEALGFGSVRAPRRECPKEPAPTPPCEPCPNWPDCGDEWCPEVATPEPCEGPPPPTPPTPAEEYQGALYRRLAGLVQEPSTPLVAPPEVLRVWLLPYEGEGGEFFMERYVYVMVQKPHWVLGTYLTEPDGTTQSERSARPEGK